MSAVDYVTAQIAERIGKMRQVEIQKAMDKNMLENCLEIRRQVFIIEKGVPKEIEVDKYDCLEEACSHFLVRYQNKDVGTIRCLETSSDRVRIQRFCFLKEYRGLGLGKIVIAYIENYYKRQGYSTVEMDAKYEVFGFYEKCGYQRVSDVFIEAGIPHVKMQKEIRK